MPFQVRSTATYQKTDPKVDPKLAAALDIIINCESLKPFIESLLDKVKSIKNSNLLKIIVNKNFLL